MPNFRRLQHAVAGLKNERFALILVDDFHPSGLTKDHLEPDLVIVNVVGNGTAFRNGDMRRDDATSDTIGNQIAIFHTRTTHVEFGNCDFGFGIFADVKRLVASREQSFTRSVGWRDHVEAIPLLDEQGDFGIEIGTGAQG
jgi:hypothetical protein